MIYFSKNAAYPTFLYYSLELYPETLCQNLWMNHNQCSCKIKNPKLCVRATKCYSDSRRKIEIVYRWLTRRERQPSGSPLLHSLSSRFPYNNILCYDNYLHNETICLISSVQTTLSSASDRSLNRLCDIFFSSFVEFRKFMWACRKFSDSMLVLDGQLWTGGWVMWLAA